MTNAEAIAILKTYDVNFYNDDGHKIRADKICEALDVAIKALEQEPSVSENPNNCDLISRGEVLENAFKIYTHECGLLEVVGVATIETLPSIKPQTGHCKDCKYFEYDSVAKVDGIPLIVAHEICNKWGDGCKTREDGYCFLFEPNMSENPTSSKPEISSFYGLRSYVRERSDKE